MGSGRMSVVSVPSLPAGHPVLLGGKGSPWRRVALLLPDPHRMVLGHDPVIVPPLKEVTLELGEKKGVSIQLWSLWEDVPTPSFPAQRSSLWTPAQMHTS